MKILLCILISLSAYADRGQTGFSQNCVVCHGDKGEGDGPAAAGLNPKPRNLVKDKFKNGDSVYQIYNTITFGLEGTAMPSFASLSVEDRVAITNYVHSLRK